MINNITPIKQKDSIGCGPACIQMAANTLGKDISYSEIAKVSKCKIRGGLSNKELVNDYEKFNRLYCM